MNATLGVEEEYHLVEPSGELARRSAMAASASSGDLGDCVHAELQTTELEVATRVCTTLSDLRTELIRGRVAAADAAARTGAAILAAGTHPFATWRELERVALPRYETLAYRFGAVVDRQGICGCHVHVSVPDLETALAVMNRARQYVPLLAALTASSPFHDGVDTRFASFRTVWWSTWPTSGPPPLLRSVAAYERVVRELADAGVVDDASTLYWDIRPSTRYPTLEFRAADVCTDIDDAVLHAGLVRSLVRTLLGRTERTSLASDSVVAAARWRAARFGIEGDLCDPTSGAVIPAALAIRRLVAELEPDLREHDEFTEIADLLECLLARGTSAEQQRSRFSHCGDLRQVVQYLVDRTNQLAAAPSSRTRSPA